MLYKEKDSGEIYEVQSGTFEDEFKIVNQIGNNYSFLFHDTEFEDNCEKLNEELDVQELEDGQSFILDEGKLRIEDIGMPNLQASSLLIIEDQIWQVEEAKEGDIKVFSYSSKGKELEMLELYDILSSPKVLIIPYNTQVWKMINKKIIDLRLPYLTNLTMKDQAPVIEISEGNIEIVGTLSKG